MIKYNEIKQILQFNNLLVKYKIKYNINIKSISCDSREINEDSIFFCKGRNFTEKYLNEAIKKGSKCYISEKYFEGYDCSYFIVTDILKAMALISAKFYNYPAKDMNLIGVTGTKGKTTTTYFLKDIFEKYLNTNIGLISSIDINTGKRIEESHLTTPESIELNKYFCEMRESNFKYAVIEVSSQSYKRDRLYGVEFEYGVFTNIAEDHISRN